MGDFGADLLLWSAGQFEFDGEGHVLRGSRRLLLPTVTPDGRVHVEVSQEFTGTYEVRPDGSGTMTLSMPAVASWAATYRWQLAVPAGDETVRFVLKEGGRSLWLASSFKTTFEERIHPFRALDEVSILVRGEAERTEDPCGSAETSFPPGRGGHVGLERGAWER